MKVGRYHVLNRYHALILITALFALAVFTVLLVGSIPTVLTQITANSQNNKIIRCTDRSQGVVCLTFNAYGSDQNINDLNRVLSKYNVKATFFVTGDWAERHTDSALLLHKDGHKIMNLSDNTSGLTMLSKNKMIEKINRCGDIIQAITGERPSFFRSPDEEYNQKLIETLTELDMQPIGWDVASYDEKGLDEEGIVRRVTSLVASGSIVKLNVDGDNIVEALPSIITKLQNKGFKFITIPEMVYAENYKINNQGRQIFFKN
jgi:peptidoglycan/xylan/chitin deacetylase (PgdA/CDA1 family)